jgi:hypothetical protein
MKTNILTWSRAFVLVPIAVLAGCASAPPGPHVAVMPAPGKPFEVFVGEDQYCRSYAEQSAGANAADTGAQRMAGSAVVGTVVGAAAGSALGGRHNGTATGAGMGMIAGTAIGANQGAMVQQEVQRRYDIAYQQCMYAKGNQVPGTSYRQTPAVSVPPQYPPPSYVPPAAYPPPPPPPPPQ